MTRILFGVCVNADRVYKSVLVFAGKRYAGSRFDISGFDICTAAKYVRSWHKVDVLSGRFLLQNTGAVYQAHLLTSLVHCRETNHLLV